MQSRLDKLPFQTLFPSCFTKRLAMLDEANHEGLARCGTGKALCSSEPTQIKVMPPRGGPCQGKRRPRPGSFGRGGTPRPIAQRSPEEQAPSVGMTALEDEVLRLRGMVAELTARCQNQNAELQSLRAEKCSCTTNAEVQTDTPISGDSGGTTPATSSADCREDQRILDTLHREVGEKGRELRRSQDTVRLLRSELQQQQEVSEQYHAQVEMLEEQLRVKSQQLRQATEEARTSASRTRPSSAQLIRARQDGSFGSSRELRGSSRHLSASSRKPLCSTGDKGIISGEDDEDVAEDDSDSEEQEEIILSARR
eukprot:TRINITY_DN77581_c0_g1_i1.p1 TRINITY_DN77581_c0_g1~~TRINITY_DN77581_c0_g1_i1.p1  ORF type:complete len:311 (-),score=62.22 TRINITY_DN77581_c0_g1_i1:131-1063(-)